MSPSPLRSAGAGLSAPACAGAGAAPLRFASPPCGFHPSRASCPPDRRKPGARLPPPKLRDQPSRAARIFRRKKQTPFRPPPLCFGATNTPLLLTVSREALSACFPGLAGGLQQQLIPKIKGSRRPPRQLSPDTHHLREPVKDVSLPNAISQQPIASNANNRNGVASSAAKPRARLSGRLRRGQLSWAGLSFSVVPSLRGGSRHSVDCILFRESFRPLDHAAQLYQLRCHRNSPHSSSAKRRSGDCRRLVGPRPKRLRREKVPNFCG